MYEPIAPRFIVLLCFCMQPMFVSIAFVNWLINEPTTSWCSKQTFSQVNQSAELSHGLSSPH